MQVNSRGFRSFARRRPLAAVAVLIGLTASVSLLAGRLPVRAQSSVEKLPTSSEAKQPVDSSLSAAEAMQRPNEKPAPEKTGRVMGDYAWSSAIEAGYRFVDSDGSRDRFLSDLYLRNGLRLLDLNLDARSISGRGGLFDFMRADATNGAGDASQSYYLRLEKSRLYRFDGTVREFNFYRYLPSFALGQHNFDLDQKASDFNFKLFPQRTVRLNLGYSRSSAAGPLSTTYGVEGDAFQIAGRSRWESNDYRIGMETTYRRWDFSLGGIYRYFKNDTEYFQEAGTVNQGNNPAVTSASLDFFNRDQPTRSKATVVHGSVRGDLTRRLHLVALGSHTGDRLNANQFDQLTGTGMALGAGGTPRILLNQIAATGYVKQTSDSSDVGLSYDITENISLSDSFRYYAFRVAGDVTTLTQRSRRSQTGVLTNTATNTLDNRLTDYRSYWNTLQLQFNYGRRFSANAGWRATHRTVTLTNPDEGDGRYPQTNHTLISGLRVRPVKNTSLFFDYERGETDLAFVRTNPLAYRRFRVRANVRVTNSFSLDSALTATDTANPAAQVNQEGDFRAFSVSATWEPKERLWLTGGYNYDYLFSTADIIFYTNFRQNQGRSIYYARQNAVFVDSRFGLTRRLDIFLVYRYLQDRGAPASIGFPTGRNDFLNSLPLHRHNPEARVSFRFNRHTTGSISYRHYSYNEIILNPEDYRANILTTSLRFVF
jgi:hypothetical protein